MRRILFHPFCGLMILLLIVQQLIVASSTIWIVQLAAALHHSSNYLVPIVLYLSSLLLPYFPGGLALIYVEKWSQTSQWQLIQASQEKLNHKPLLWINRTEQEEKVPLFAKEGLQIVSGFTSYFYDLVASSLNSLLNILTISLIVEPLFLVGYGISLLMAGLLVHFQAPINQRIAASTELSRLRLSSVLFRMWDNLTLGNSYNQQIWNQRVSERFFETRQMSVKSATFNQWIAIGIALLTLLPTFIIIFWSLKAHNYDAAFAIVMVVTLPRVFQILNSSYQVLALISSWSQQKGKIEILRTLFRFQPDEGLMSRIKFDQLNLEKNGKGQQASSIEDCLRHFSQPGRITIRGPNGSGKSTLLLLLKNTFGNRAYYLPAHHSLAFQSESKQGSTGERLFESLQEITKNDSSPILLLDEWDANLDDTNKEKITLLLDDLAKGKVVAEVRHHS